MDRQLKLYFENIIELEKSVYTQSNTLLALKQEIDGLGRKAYVKKVEAGKPESLLLNIFMFSFILVPGLAVIGFISSWGGGLFKGLLVGAMLGLGAATVCGIVKYLIGRSIKKCEQAEHDSDYSKRIAADNKRLAEENKQKNRLIKLRDDLMNQHLRTLEVLQQYYGIGIIFPKYRNLNAVCSFYEYFMSGRCSTFTGHEGAYNIFESELRANLILAKLDDILAHLEQIKENQYLLYTAINESNRRINSLISESKRQTQLANFNAEQTAIAAYNASEARNELNQIKWLKTCELLHKNY